MGCGFTCLEQGGKMSNLKTCKNCGWVHFGLTRDQAQLEVEKFHTHFKTLTKQQQDDYYGGRSSSIKEYEECMRCGHSHLQFRDAMHDDCPDGCTINPIIVEEV